MARNENEEAVSEIFSELQKLIGEVACRGFERAVTIVTDYVDHDSDYVDSLRQIGMIPESIEHDSTEEKLFSKASDAMLSRAFREIGLKSTVLKERADSADVLAQSPVFGYTLIADAKAFRMSRTAKNQKDFKVSALSGWRNDNDYAVLCCPYFQYPTRNSQIYAQAIDHNVCLLSWEHLVFLLEHGMKESMNLNLSALWNFSESYAHKVSAADRKNCFLGPFNRAFLELIHCDEDLYDTSLKDQVLTIMQRGDFEKRYWEEQIDIIHGYSREEAISELIQSKKIAERISQIDSFLRGLRI